MLCRKAKAAELDKLMADKADLDAMQQMEAELAAMELERVRDLCDIGSMLPSWQCSEKAASSGDDPLPACGLVSTLRVCNSCHICAFCHVAGG